MKHFNSWLWSELFKNVSEKKLDLPGGQHPSRRPPPPKVCVRIESATKFAPNRHSHRRELDRTPCHRIHRSPMDNSDREGRKGVPRGVDDMCTVGFDCGGCVETLKSRKITVFEVFFDREMHHISSVRFLQPRSTETFNGISVERSCKNCADTKNITAI